MPSIATILRFAPWAIAGLMLLGALWYRGQYESCLAAGAKALAAQIEQDKAENAKAVAALNEQLRTVENKIVTVTEKVYAAPITRDCAQSPAMRAASDGLRQLFSGGEAEHRREPAAAVPGPNAGARGGKRQ
jgi:hypothetical protein